jgi:beta-lactam-binding protein with PASTA domain
VPWASQKVLVKRLISLAGVAMTACLLAACTKPPSPPPGVTVPNVVGVTTMVADGRLQAADLLLEVNATGPSIPTKPDGLIQSQVPSPGTDVPVGSTVTVRAVCTPKPCPSPIGGQHIYDPCTCATR